MPTKTVKIAKLHPDAQIPAPQSAQAACFDIHAVVEGGELIIPAGGVASVGTGIAVEIPDGYRLDVVSRSGLWFKNKVRVGQGRGTIDADYRAEIKVSLENIGNDDFIIKTGDRIAQAELNEVTRVVFDEVTFEDLSKTDRGAGGFGSTGV